jgi:alpha-1,4-digalacturonate transport system substrate-binding protein
MLAAPATAQPIVELRYLCYQNGDECEISRDLLERFNRDNPDVRVAVDIVSFNVVREQLETRLNTGQGPDMARVTNLGGFHRFYLDLTPYIDAAAWERAFGPTLDWLRAGANDRGVYGFMTQLTVSGPIVNRSLFERARVPMPGAGASWDDWAEAIAEVKRRTGVYSGIALDRSGHRFAGPAISYGARFLGEDGRALPPDAGVRAFAERMVRWHREGLMPPDLWPSATGARLRNGDDMFINGDVVMHYGGSWQIQRYAEEIGERFDWVVAPNPCGPAACSGMPGGAAMVAFRHTRHPSAVARVMSYMASEPVLREFYGRALQIPAHRGLAGRIEYPAGTPRPALAALAAFAANYAAVTPSAHRLQAYSRNHIVFNAIAEHVTSAINGRATMDDALARIEAEIRRGAR